MKLAKEIIKDSIQRHGLTGPIVKARLNYIKDKPILTINGHKREEVSVELNLKLEVIILDADTKEEYLQLLQDFKEPRLSANEKKDRANIHAYELKKAGCEPGQICKAVAYLTGMSYCQTARYLGEEFKDPLKQEAGCSQMRTEGCSHGNPNGFHLRDDWGWLDKVTWIRVIKVVKNESHLYALMDAIKNHFLEVKNNLTLKNISIEELSDVLLEKLEDPELRLSDEIVARLKAILPEAE